MLFSLIVYKLIDIVTEDKKQKSSLTKLLRKNRANAQTSTSFIAKGFQQPSDIVLLLLLLLFLVGASYLPICYATLLRLVLR